MYIYIRISGTFSDKVTPYIDYFTDEPLVQCDIPVAKKTL